MRIKEYSEDAYLSDGELEMYDFMRLKYDENRPKILETQYEEFNRQMQLVEDYWPISIDMKESTKDPKIAEIFKDFDLSNGDDLEISKVTNYMAYGTETKHGFTEQTTTLPLIVRLDARSTFLTHMDDASYFANMQQAIKRTNEIVKIIAPQMGTYSEKRVREYLGMLARKGTEPVFAKDRSVLTNIFDATARNLPSAALVGNVSNYFVQLTAVVEMLTTHGIPAGEAFKWMSDPKIANFIKEHSSLQYREEVDFTRYAKGEWIQNMKNASKGVKNLGMLPIKVMDQLVGKTVWYSAYLDFKERGFTEEQAILEAELLTKKTIASGHIIDNAMAITRLKNKPGFVWLSVFQTFISNHSFGIIRFAGGDQSKIVRKTSKALGLSKRGTSIMKWGSAMMFMFVVFPALEELIRRLTGRKPRSIGEMSFQTFASMVPYLNSLYGLSRFGGPMGEIFTSAENSIKAITSDKDPARHMTRLAFAIMAALGVPGSIQAGKEVLE